MWNLHDKITQTIEDNSKSSFYRCLTNQSTCEENVITEYKVFPYVQMAYYDIHLESGKLEREMCKKSKHILEIIHCREGRMEREFGDDFFYLSPDDLVIMKKPVSESMDYFPLSHYHGISILIDTDYAPNCLTYFPD